MDIPHDQLNAKISRDDLKTMTPQQIVDANNAGQLDHLYAEQVERAQARRDERAARARVEAERKEFQRRVARGEFDAWPDAARPTERTQP